MLLWAEKNKVRSEKCIWNLPLYIQISDEADLKSWKQKQERICINICKDKLYKEKIHIHELKKENQTRNITNIFTHNVSAQNGENAKEKQRENVE